MDEPLSITLRLLLVVALVLANGLFVAAEFSIVTTRRARMESLAAQGNPFARLVSRAIDNVNNYLAATQLGITMASIGLGWVGEPLLADVIEPAFGWLPEKGAGPASHTVAVPLAFALITSLHIVLGELAPKSLAIWKPERVSLAATPPTEVFRLAFWPAIWLLNGLANAALLPFGLRAPTGGTHSVHTAEEIQLLVSESRSAGVLERREAELLQGVFDFGDRRINEVMIPRTEVVWLEKGMTIADLYGIFSEHPHSRFPVFQDSPDNAIGIVGIKDVLRGVAEKQLDEGSPVELAMRPAMFVPETKFVGALFFEMQRSGQQMAVVADEYGGTAGVVTLETLLEEMVGNVGDELRRNEEEVVSLDERTFDIDAGMSISDANDELHLDLPEGEYETVAGFVLSHLGRIPQQGEQFVYNGLRIAVSEMRARKVERLTVTRLQSPS
jgi:CBS domain containing-hemolysin-like protein